jgi:hypothetical protein
MPLANQAAYPNFREAAAITVFSFLLALCRTVLTSTAFSVLNTGCIERSAYDVISNARKIGNLAAADEHD